MSDFDNDPYDEAPVHQFDESGDVDFDEGVGPGETRVDASSGDERDAN